MVCPRDLLNVLVGILEGPMGELASVAHLILPMATSPHRLPVGTWLQQIDQEGQCQICHKAKESPKHCLWGYTHARKCDDSCSTHMRADPIVIIINIDNYIHTFFIDSFTTL